MKQEHSYGVIPLRQKEGRWQVLLIQHHAGHWAFPKGHADRGETPRQAAERELAEETGLKIKVYLAEEPLSESYWFTVKQQKIHKTVDYFIAVVEGRVVIQEAEIQASRWLDVEEAAAVLTFPQAKKLCGQVQQLLHHSS